MTRLRQAFLVSVVAALAGTLPAQITNFSVDVGAKDTFGCQNKSNPPTLDNGTPASATVAFRYDAAKGELRLTLTNTSKVTKGVPNPLITDVYFAIPTGAVTCVKIVSPTKLFGAVTPSTMKDGCFGTMGAGVALKNKGIANANADTIDPAKGSYVTGPTTVVLQLTGPGTKTLTAGLLANGYSKNATYAVGTAVKFQSGGKGGEYSGKLSNGQDCAAGVHLMGEVKIGSKITAVSSGLAGCHGCVLISCNPGPSKLGMFNLPLGLPLVEIFVLPQFPSGNEIFTTLQVPDDPNLVDKKVYLAVFAFNDNQWNFSQRTEFVFVK